MKFVFRIHPDGREPFEVVARSRDIASWERSGRGRSLAKLEHPSVVDLESLAHAAALRQGLFDGPLTEFQETCDFEVVQPETDDGEGEDPTQMAR